MVGLPEDTLLDIVDASIAEAETRRAEQVGLITCLEATGQPTDGERRRLREIEATLATLCCRRSYLAAMRTKP